MISTFVYIVFLLLSLTKLCTAQSTPSFIRTDIAEYSRNYTTGDFNDDHYNDLAVILMNHLVIYLGEGTGQFSLHEQIDIEYSNMVVTADVNNDGFQDIITNGMVHLGNNSGSFNSFIEEGFYTTDYSAVVSDINHDGNQDILYKHEYQLFGALGEGDGTFSTPHLISPYSFRPEICADVTNDGFIDLLIVYQYDMGEKTASSEILSSPLKTKELMLLQGNGDGSFSDPLLILSISNAYELNIQQCDYNNDENLDVFIVTGQSLQIYAGNGAGFFTLAWQGQLPDPANTPYEPLLSDINNDSFLDIVEFGNKTIENDFTQTLLVRYGMSNGSFQDAVSIPFPGTQFIKGTWNLINVNNDDLSDYVVHTTKGDGLIGISVFTQQGESSIINGNSPLPSFSILQNYPNPFNNYTNISYYNPKDSFVTIDIYTISGQHVCSIYNKLLLAGTYYFLWEGIDEDMNKVGSGVYICAVINRTCKNISSVRIVLQK